MKRLVIAAVAWFALLGGVAYADPPGPTDYLTEIVAIEPPAADAIEATMEGGDAFLQLAVAPGHTAIVYGYQDEEYLRFDADGSVYANQRSESLYYNEERYGGDIPDEADSSAEPEWKQVAADGVYAWHDHRAHWMSKTPLAGLQPGDALPQQVIDLDVDGTATEIIVETTLQPEPSPLPLVIGALVGVAVIAGLIVERTRALTFILVSAATAAVGIGQFFAVPSTTGPSWSWIALPSLAVVCSIAAASLPPKHFARPVLWLGAGVIFVIWAYQRLDVATAAYVPNVLGGFVDRTVSTVGALAGLTAIGIGVWSFIQPPDRSPH